MTTASEATLADTVLAVSPTPAIKHGGWTEPTVAARPHNTWLSRQRVAYDDLRQAMRLWRLCWTLSWLDIKLRYRGSLLGPFWLTLSTAIMVGAMGLLYSTLFHMNLHEYLPFLVLSIVLWNFLSNLVGDGCVGFLNAEGMIRSVQMPFWLYAARIVIRNVFVLGHNVVVILAVFALLNTWPGHWVVLALPAFLLWLIDGLAAAALLGALCARFRDIPPIVASVIQIAFFITPVIWKPELVGPARAALLPLNPFYSLLAVLREPLLGVLPTTMTYVSALGFSLALCAASWLAFARVRGRIAFWVVNAVSPPLRASEARIDVAGLSVDFPLYHGTARSLKKTLFSSLSGRMGSDAKNRVVVQAVRDVSFALRPGDRLGLVGGNGAGKTTLLRTLAGIFEPVVGTVRVQGTLNALLDPMLGMNPDLTGRENILLRGLYAGLSQAAIARLEDDVRDFAQLDTFMDLPVRIYSSGMVVRLGFALATAIRPQVLLMDEWFLAGDAAFMDRARERLEGMVRGADILVLSTHQADIVTEWCTRVIWLDQGRVRADGAPAEVLAAYLGHPRAPEVHQPVVEAA